MREFSEVHRIVVKVGTTTLTKEGRLDTAYIRRISKQITEVVSAGKQVVLVSSGAIGMGATELGLQAMPKDMKLRQACAAIGQPLLMSQYRRAFQRLDINVGQVLLTAEVLDHRKTYLNLRHAVETLLKLGVVPILNENDSVSTEEIKSAFGDNDKLSALVASKIDADLLIILSDIDALYDRNPKRHPEANAIGTVFDITDDVMQHAGGRGSRYGTGGMKTKLEAARIAAQAGCRMVLAHGRTRDVLNRVLSGEALGTLFLPKRRLSNRARWILNSTPAGTITIDPGASKAIHRRKSLLPSGVTHVEGHFEAGAVVLINEVAKAVTSLSSGQLKTLMGRHSREIKKLCGPTQRDVVAIPDDIILIDA